MAYRHFLVFCLVVGSFILLVSSQQIVFPIPRETCPEGFAETILGSFNLYRSKHGHLPPLTLSPALTANATFLNKFSRCDGCPLQFTSWSSSGQLDFTVRLEGTTQQFTFEPSHVLEHSIVGPGVPAWTGTGPAVRYSYADWAAVREMGVSCASYYLPLKEHYIATYLKVIFTFDAPASKQQMPSRIIWPINPVFN